MDSGGFAEKLRAVVNTAMNLRGFHNVGGRALHFLWYARIASCCIQTCTRYHLVHGVCPSCCVTASATTTTEQHNNTGSGHSLGPDHRLTAKHFGLKLTDTFTFYK